MIIKLSESARKDLHKGFNYYEEKSSGLGNYYIDSMFSEIDSLQIYAGIHIKIDNHFRLLTKRFPYSIYYRIVDEIIYIDAVLDCRSDPENIHKRIK
ncbi:MAG: type II toxin-antitoxin system RelE/ParE family toxin [Calditrichaeota bacterium]|nr:type II toxin-antitoxin system RelE/ParE family toxin [Spirochaetales bacterium]RQW01387.1 MAG: type II toxin-antitoxin system RelE/ParE family toxin [Calditrichota bacterium]